MQITNSDLKKTFGREWLYLNSNSIPSYRVNILIIPDQSEPVIPIQSEPLIPDESEPFVKID
jgi:hypothetical protein